MTSLAEFFSPKSTKWGKYASSFVIRDESVRRTPCICAEECYTKYDICLPIFIHVDIVYRMEGSRLLFSSA